ncbi:MAG: transporter substrate-binding domain-containing protein [Pseudomonadota bacterium]
MTIRRTLGLAAAALVIGATAAHAQNDVLRIGTEGAYPPWNATDASGDLIGFEIELGLALCAELERTCEFVAQDWDGMIPALLNGRYDLIMAGMSITEERQQTITFSNGYAQTPAHFAAHPDSEHADIETIDHALDALDGAVIGVQVGTIHQNFITDHLPNAELRFYDTQDQLNLDLVAGRIDAGLADVTAWIDLNEAEGDEAAVTIGEPMTGVDFEVFGAGVGVGMRHDDTELHDQVNAALAALHENGTLEALAHEWFGFDASLEQPGS